MTWLGRVGSGTLQTSATSQAITITQVVPAGSLIVGGCAMEAGSSVYPTITVADTRGNTYSSSASANQGATVSTRLFWSKLTTALQVGDTVTITASASRNRWATALEAFDDGNTADQFSSAIGTTAAVNAGTTGTTSQATELVVAAYGSSGTPTPTLTAGSGFTQDGPLDCGAASSNRGISMEWKYVTVVGTQTAPGTLSAAVAWAGAVQTFTQAAVGGGGTRTGKAKVWSGSAWVQHPVKRWSGTAWEIHPAKGWDGTQWLLGK